MEFLGASVARYLDILDQLDYINLENGIVTEGRRMDSANLQDVGSRSYVEVIMGDPVHLDLEVIQGNIRKQYGKDFGELYVEDKLNQLSQVDVIEKDGDYVTSVDEVFDTVN